MTVWRVLSVRTIQVKARARRPLATRAVLSATLIGVPTKVLARVQLMADLSSGGLPHPAYTVQEEGRIVVNIVVDPVGNVIAADIGKGTNIDNASMRRSAVEAACRAKFNSIEGTNNQSGTITYMFRLK